MHSEYINTVHVMPELHFQDMTFHSKLGRLDPLSIQSHMQMLTLMCKNTQQNVAL